MKGFMHIVEVLLIVLLVFFVFSQFASIPRISDDWSRTKLSLMGSDVLRALEMKGTDWFDKTEVEYELNRTLPKNLVYSVLLENVIKPEIVIGCLCSDSEMNVINDILYPGSFFINDEKVEFEVIGVDDPSELFSLDFDVALVYGYEDFSINPYPLRNFLNYDRGIVEISDNPVIDSVQNTTFGLGLSGTTSGSYEITFSDSSRENGKELNKIYDYFHHIPLFYSSFESLGQWREESGKANISDIGKPGPSVKLTGSDCLSINTLIYTKFYNSFKRGEIDFDAYLDENASLFVGLGEYYASLSTNESSGYDSFYDQSMNPIGSDTSHLTEPWRWNHIKIMAKGNDLMLYNKGERVAIVPASVSSPSNISFFNLCGEAYVDNVRVTHEESYRFGNFLDNENTTQSRGDVNKILLEQEWTDSPACIINYNVEGIGKGRTVWLSENPSYDSGYKTLVKSLVSWAAGNKYRVIKANIKRPVSSRIYKPLNKDMFQNMKISLELGYLY